MRTIGIDPGLRKTGWGVIEAKGNHVRCVAHGVIQVPATDLLGHRLDQIFIALEGILAEQRPHYAAIENTFVNVNARSSLALGQARGIAILACHRFGVPIFEPSPTAIKKAITGQGRADKSQVMKMIHYLLPGESIRSPDSADALAAALWYIHQPLLWSAHRSC